MRNQEYNWLFLGILVFNFLTIGVSGLEVNNSCIDCHKNLNPNLQEDQSGLNKIIINHSERNISCSIGCHNNILINKAINNYQQWSESDHANYFVTCDNCHGGDPHAKTKEAAHKGVLNSTVDNSTIYFKNIPETCGKCHSEEIDNFKNSMHYQRLNADALAPSCKTCHQPHTFKVPATANIIPLCSRCHNPTDMPALANIPVDAKKALDQVNTFKVDIAKIKESINLEKSKGIDIGTAQNDLDNAMSVMNKIPSMWHGFDLKNFDEQIQIGNNYLDRAQNELAGVNNTAKTIPNIPIIVIFGILILTFFYKKKQR